VNELTPRLEWLLRLNAVTGVSTTKALAVWERLGERLCSAAAEEWAEAGELDLETARRARTEALVFDARAEWDRARAVGARILALGEPDYPEMLRSISDPPLLLYIKGEARFAEEPAPLAFVGTRRPTPYGARMARVLAKEAAAEGAVVVSGLARGIDSEAHEAALSVRGKTWAVLGSGLGRIYPAENADLARRIVQGGGCLVSEYPVDASPLKGRFPRRNRIISGLSWGTIVVEGAMHSGSLITARLSIEQGRPVFAVPGPADSRMSGAPHMLINQGAKLITRMKDVWEDLPDAIEPQASLYSEPAAPTVKSPSLSLECKKILELLGPDARSLDELGQITGIDLSRLSNIIFEMELRDLVAPVPGQRYAKKTS